MAPSSQTWTPFLWSSQSLPSLFKGLDSENFHCDVCQLAKYRCLSFPINNKRSSIPFALIHSSIWCPSTIPNISGTRWFVSFIDDCTRVTWIFLLKSKFNISNVVPNFHTMIKNQFGVFTLKDLGQTMQGIISIKFYHHTSNRK